jgi:hypothetical protein
LAIVTAGPLETGADTASYLFRFENASFFGA